jgi:hypothetical protein
MSLNQATIYQEEAFAFAKAMMGETTPGLVKLKIKTDAKGSKSLHKDKSSESLPILLRPMYSTNYSDAFKYLINRSNFVSQVNTHSQFTGMDPSVV